MADYSTNLKSWGSSGVEFPDSYNYLDGEAPVDAWDNFVNYNLITDVKDHLIPLTNSRIESDYGTSFPSSPEDGHLFYDTDDSDRRLSRYRADTDSWDDLALGKDLRSHERSTDNPHNVDLAQARAQMGINEPLGDHLWVGTSTPPEMRDADWQPSDETHYDIYGVDRIICSQGIIGLHHGDFELHGNEFTFLETGTDNELIYIDPNEARFLADLVTQGGLTIEGTFDIGDNAINGLNGSLNFGASDGHIHAVGDFHVEGKMLIDGTPRIEMGTAGFIEYNSTRFTIGNDGTQNLRVNHDGTVEVRNGVFVASEGFEADSADLTGDITLGGDLIATDGELIWSEADGYIPQGRLQNDAVTVSTGNQLSGGGSVALGGSLTIDVDDGAGSGLNADLLDGIHRSNLSWDNMAISQSDVDLSDVGAANIALDMNGYDIVDGSTVYDASAGHVPLSILEQDSVTVNAGNQLTGGGTISLGESVTIDLDEGAGSGLNADTVDGMHAADLGSGASEDGTQVYASVTDFNFTGHLNVTDDGDGTVSIDPSHNHDNRYVNTGGDSMSGDLSIGDVLSLRHRTDHGQIHLQDPDGTNFPQFRFDSAGVTEARIQLDSANGVLEFRTGGNTSAVRIDSSQNLSVTNGTILEQGNRVATRAWATGNNIPIGDLYGVSGQGSGGGLDADLLDGKHASAFAESGHNHDSRYVNENGDTMSGTLQVEGDSTDKTTLHGHKISIRDFHTDSDGNPDQYGYIEFLNSAGERGGYFGHGNGGSELGLYLDQATALDVHGPLLENDDRVATRTWVNGNADVPNADHADEADTLDGKHASAFAESGHTHDGRYVNVGGDTMSGSLDIRSGSLDNVHYDTYSNLSLEHKDSRLQIISSGDGSNASSLSLTTAPQDGTDNRHWTFHHTTSGSMEVGYLTTSQTGTNIVSNHTPSLVFDSNNDVNAPNGDLREQGNRVATRSWATGGNIAVGDLSGVSGQGASGGLDADLLDGTHLADITWGDVDMAKYTDSEAVTALDGSSLDALTVTDLSVDTINGTSASDFGSGGVEILKGGASYGQAEFIDFQGSVSVNAHNNTSNEDGAIVTVETNTDIDLMNVATEADLPDTSGPAIAYVEETNAYYGTIQDGSSS